MMMMCVSVVMMPTGIIIISGDCGLFCCSLARVCVCVCDVYCLIHLMGLIMVFVVFLLEERWSHIYTNIMSAVHSIYAFINVDEANDL